jgi:hypothetical protein
MPEDAVERIEFYIGNDRGKLKDQGVAGETFKDGKLRVGHMIRENNKWTCREYSSYINFTDRRFLPYESLVCVPIPKFTLKPSSGETIGVICFDSKHPATFDNPGAHQLLEALGNRVGAALSIYWQNCSGGLESEPGN